MVFLIVFGGWILLDLIFLLFLIATEPSEAEKKANRDSGFMWNPQTRKFESMKKDE